MKTGYDFARRREECTDDDIKLFKSQCALFYDTWISLHDTVGVTNHNLYWPSQQGWKAVNRKIKLFFNDTQHIGGHAKIKKGEETL